jgi:hypothetical protein
MPESVTDRPTKAHEYSFLLSKSAKYFCDMDAIQEPAIHAGVLRKLNVNKQAAAWNVKAFSGNMRADAPPVKVGEFRNKRERPLAPQGTGLVAGDGSEVFWTLKVGTEPGPKLISTGHCRMQL